MISAIKKTCATRLRQQLALLALCSLGAAQVAQAQTDAEFIYTAKFVCGAQRIPTTLQTLPRDPGFQDFQPGSYATTLNILNLFRFAPRVNVRATLAESSPSTIANSRVVSDQPVPIFGAMKVGCADIAAAFGRSSSDVFEGFLYIIQPQDYLDVQAVYTYSEQDEFQSERFVGIGVNNQVGDINAPAPGSNSNVITAFRIMGGAGSGGLGIGNSIHIERIAARAMPALPMLDPDIVLKPTRSQ